MLASMGIRGLLDDDHVQVMRHPAQSEAPSFFQSREAIRFTATARPNELVISFPDDRAICMVLIAPSENKGKEWRDGGAISFASKVYKVVKRS